MSPTFFAVSVDLYEQASLKWTWRHERAEVDAFGLQLRNQIVAHHLLLHLLHIALFAKWVGGINESDKPINVQAASQTGSIRTQGSLR